MVNQLKPTIRAYMDSDNTNKRYIRVKEMAGTLELDDEDIKLIAIAAGALYKLSRIELVHKERFEKFMRHIYRVPGTNKLVQKKFLELEKVQLFIALVIIGLLKWQEQQERHIK